MSKAPNFIEYSFTPKGKAATAQDEGLVTPIINTPAAQPLPVPTVEDIIAKCCAIHMVAKDLHYCAYGTPFYSMHEFADMMAALDKNNDELNEVYFMGSQAGLPPPQAMVCEKAVNFVKGRNVAERKDQAELAHALREFLTELTNDIEDFKAKMNPKSGVQAILDEISKNALQCNGLLDRVLALTPPEPVVV